MQDEVPPAGTSGRARRLLARALRWSAGIAALWTPPWYMLLLMAEAFDESRTTPQAHLLLGTAFLVPGALALVAVAVSRAVGEPAKHRFGAWLLLAVSVVVGGLLAAFHHHEYRQQLEEARAAAVVHRTADSAVRRLQQRFDRPDGHTSDDGGPALLVRAEAPDRVVVRGEVPTEAVYRSVASIALRLPRAPELQVLVAVAVASHDGEVSHGPWSWHHGECRSAYHLVPRVRVGQRFLDGCAGVSPAPEGAGATTADAGLP